MAVTKRKDGSYRSYHKIGGEEFQVYSRDKSDAEAKQKKLDEQADNYVYPIIKKLFSEDMFIGFSIKCTSNKLKRPYIEGRVQVTKDGSIQRSCKKLTSFYEAWNWIYTNWVQIKEVSEDQLKEFECMIKVAKHTYHARYYKEQILFKERNEKYNILKQKEKARKYNKN